MLQTIFQKYCTSPLYIIVNTVLFNILHYVLAIVLTLAILFQCLNFRNMIRGALKIVLDNLLRYFPQQFSFVFAYGSSVFPQQNKLISQDSMVDLIFVVDDPLTWHRDNLQMNSKHYSVIKFAGPEMIYSVQMGFGAKVYFNTHVAIGNRFIKYGVIRTDHLIEDLLDWQTLYISGRLHKPVKIIQETNNSELLRALNTNLQSALHASLLCLPEEFTEEQLYAKIAGLSYSGDFRMYFGEDKKKVSNIVKNQIPYFRNLYGEHLRSMPLVHWRENDGVIEQDTSNESALYHLNLLPKNVQHHLLLRWNKDGRYRDMEDVLPVLACDSECGDLVERAVRDIIWWFSITQSLKGLLTAGVKKSFQYTSRKIKKMITSLY